MTHCPSAEQLTELATGLVDDAALRAHVDDCVACRAQLHELTAAWQQLDTWKVDAPRSGLSAEFRLVLDAEADQIPRSSSSEWSRSPRVWLAVGAAVAVALLLPFWWLSATSGSANWTVVTGIVEIRETPDARWQVASMVRPGQLVRTLNAASLSSPDGSTMELEADCECRLMKPADDVRQHWFVDQGRARFQVSPGEQAFVAETGAGQVRVIGTTFGVESSLKRPGILMAWVEDGQIEVTNQTGTATLTAGQCVCCPDTANPAATRIAPGSLVFVRNIHHPTVAFLTRVRSTAPSGVRITVGDQLRDVTFDELFARPVTPGLRVQIAQRAGDMLRAATVVRLLGDHVEVKTDIGQHVLQVALSAVHIEIDSK